MSKDIGRLLEAVNAGHVAARTLDDLAPFLDRRAAEAEDRVFSILSRGEALPVDLAVQAWYDKYAVVSLRKALANAVKRGQNASAKVDFNGGTNG